MTDKMLEHTRQQLSALFDGELGSDEARFLRKRLEHDAELAGCVSRWQLAGDILRGQATAAAPADFASRVAGAIAADAGHAPAAAVRHRRWIPGAALAASVAVVAMFMARQSPDLMPAGQEQAPVEMASTAPDPSLPPANPAPAEAPAPASPQLPDAAAQLAAATVAAAEVPRRAAARRTTSSRGQAQRAATTRVARVEQAEPQPQVAVAGAGSNANPFNPEAAPIATRPWPRALLPNAGGAFNVGYGELQPFPRDTHPFRPAPVDEAEAQPQASQPQAPVPSPR